MLSTRYYKEYIDNYPDFRSFRMAAKGRGTSCSQRSPETGIQEENKNQPGRAQRGGEAGVPGTPGLNFNRQAKKEDVLELPFIKKEKDRPPDFLTEDTNTYTQKFAMEKEGSLGPGEEEVLGFRGGEAILEKEETDSFIEERQNPPLAEKSGPRKTGRLLRKKKINEGNISVSKGDEEMPALPEDSFCETDGLWGRGLFHYRKWWKLLQVEVFVNGDRITGTPIFTDQNTLRVVNGDYSYFIPLEKVDYIRTPDGLKSREICRRGPRKRAD